MTSDAIRRLIGNTSVLLFFLDASDGITLFKANNLQILEVFDASELDKLGNVSQCFIIIRSLGKNKYR